MRYTEIYPRQWLVFFPAFSHITHQRTQHRTIALCLTFNPIKSVCVCVRLCVCNSKIKLRRNRVYLSINFWVLFQNSHRFSLDFFGASLLWLFLWKKSLQNIPTKQNSLVCMSDKHSSGYSIVWIWMTNQFQIGFWRNKTDQQTITLKNSLWTFFQKQNFPIIKIVFCLFFSAEFSMLPSLCMWVALNGNTGDGWKFHRKHDSCLWAPLATVPRTASDVSQSCTIGFYLVFTPAKSRFLINSLHF